MERASMVDADRNTKRWYYILNAIMIAVLMTMGCSNSARNCNYKEFALHKDDVRFRLCGVIIEHPIFTFEYPQCFNLIDLNGLPDIVYDARVTEVSFTRRGTGELKLLPVISSISVKVYKPGLYGDTDARTAIEKELSYYEADENFKVLERGSINVIGLSAEYVSFSTSRLFRDRSFPTHNRLVRLVSFDYAGFVWKIELVCFEEEIQETQAYFDHLLETFRVLD
jgi:hypothetical protein